MKYIVFILITVLMGCATNYSKNEDVPSNRKLAESNDVEGLNSLRGKLIKLIEISNVDVNGRKYSFKGECSEDQIDKSFRNDIVRFGVDEASVATESGICNKLTFNMIEIYPISDTKAHLLIGAIEGHIAGLFSKKETAVTIVDKASLDVSCSISNIHKTSVFGFLKYVATSELSTSERLLTCYISQSQGKVVYKILD